jgi:hypothetical protein
MQNEIFFVGHNHCENARSEKCKPVQLLDEQAKKTLE